MDATKEEYQEIVDAIHYSCMLIEDEVVEELEKKGQKMEFDKEVVAQVAFAISDTLCKTWPNELLQYAKHARRSIVNISDLTLLFRKNESMLSLIGSIVESSLLPVRKRQSRKGTNKKNAKAANSTEKMDNENSNDVDNLLFEKNTLKLADFWNQPSTSQERPLLLSETFKHSSASMEQKCMSNSISLQKKEVATEKKETLSCCKQKANAITGLRKTENSRKRQNQITKQWLQPSFDLDSSKSGEEQQLEFLDINVSPPCYSSKKDLLEQESQFDTGSFSKTNEIVRDAANLCKKAKMNEKDVMVSLLKFDDEMTAESSTTDADRETTSHKRTNKTDRNETEFQVGNLSDGKPIFSPETSVLNSIRRISKEQLTNTSSRNRSSTADDCFSSLKFQSDDEDSGQNCSLLENENADRETTSHKRTNNTDRNETEFQVGNLSDGKPIFSPEASVLNSVRSKEQLTNTSSRNRSSIADDCFSSFKFESDDEDSGQNCSLLENEITNNKNAVSSPIDSTRQVFSSQFISSFIDKYVSMNNDQEQQQNISNEESDVDLDVTVFDF